MHLLRRGVLALGLLGLVGTQACSSEEAGPGPNGTSGTSAGTTGGTSGTNGTSGAPGGGGDTNVGTSGTSGGAIAEDDGLIPTTSIWRTTTEWYRPVDAAPIAAHSAEMIGALAKWGTTGIFQIDFSINVLDGKGAPKVTIPAQDEADSDPVPIPAQGYIEGDYAYGACPDGDDCHLLVVDRSSNLLFEVYQAQKSGAAWSGFLATWQLDKTYPRTNRGLGCSSADAAGLPIVPGLIGYKETKKGAIRHALRFIMRNEYIRGIAGDRNRPNVVYPASHGSTAGDAVKGIPYGGRLRLKKTITETDPRLKTLGAKALLRALQTYGMILADGGNIPLVAESVKVHQDANAAETWDGLLEPRDLGFLQPSDFEVVAIPKDNPAGAPGWYATKAEYEAQLQKPLGCVDVVQP